MTNKSEPHDYEWHDPENVVIVHDHEFNVVAYGFRKPRPVNQIHINRRKPVMDA